MRNYTKYFFCILLLFIASSAFAQQPEANVWYFGRFLGLDFNSGTPVPLTDGKLNTDEGVATISDANGKLLFYTDGLTIYNRFHNRMPNGFGLFGNVSSTQSAVIVPKIGDKTRYYVFTVDATGGSRGLTYSIVNMTLDNGRGDVESKNIPLQSNVTEKVTAVRHCNNRDIWVLAHGTLSNTYYAFLVTTAGIITTPVISNTGIVLPGTDSATLGYLKASPDGKRLAAANWTVNAEVSDFDSRTGVVSNTYDLLLPSEKYYWAYGIEFSSNSQVLYTTTFYTDPINAQQRNVLLQYDLTLPNPTAVRTSRQWIANNSDNIITMGALQVATNGKIYMSNNVYKYLSCIDNPNVVGTGCNFILNAVQFSLPSQVCSFGLPTFVQSYFYPRDSFTYVVNCPGNKVNFNYEPGSKVRSFKWDFGDPASGANNTSLLANPVHDFSSAGTYTVQVIKFTDCGSDTIFKDVSTYNQKINLGNDTTVCSSSGSLLLHATVPGNMNSYIWQDGSTDSTLRVSASGLFWVEVTNSFGCNRRDSINVVFKPLPVINLGPDTSLCEGQLLTLNAANTNATGYLWSTSATGSTITISQPGLYWGEAISNNCRFRDTMQILAIKPTPLVNLGNDQTVCEGITAMLDASFPNSTYLWQNGSTNATYTVNTAGIYSVEVNLNGCKKSDTVVFKYNPKPRFTLGSDQYICPGRTITLKPALDASWQLQWQDGSSLPTYQVVQPGNYSLTAINNCGSASDAVVFEKGVCKVFVPTAFTPNNDGKNDHFKAVGTENVTQYHMKVFNRWGEIVFETNDKSIGWDGKIKGNALTTDVFIYLLQYKEINSDELYTLKGTMTLIK